MEVRDLKVSFNKSGNGHLTPKMSLPKKWIDEMGITPDDRDVKVTFENGEIKIKKCE